MKDQQSRTECGVAVMNTIALIILAFVIIGSGLVFPN